MDEVVIAPAERTARFVVRRRGAWDPRDDRIASAVWLGILWVGMIAGFGVDFSRFLHESPPAPTVVRVHAAVFSGWLLIMTAQVALVLGRRIAWHRRLGLLAAAWACLMAVLGPWAALSSQAVNLHNPAVGDPPFLSVNLVDIAGFIALLAWGFALRSDPAAHRRMMILATVALADPGFARFSQFYLAEPKSIPLWFVETFYGNVLLIGLMAGWDWWRGRLLRSFLIASGAILASEVWASAVYFWPPWRHLTTAIVEFWAGHFV